MELLAKKSLITITGSVGSETKNALMIAGSKARAGVMRPKMHTTSRAKLNLAEERCAIASTLGVSTGGTGVWSWAFLGTDASAHSPLHLLPNHVSNSLTIFLNYLN